MSTAQLLQTCKEKGLNIYLVNDSLKIRGADELVKEAIPLLQDRKADIIRHLKETANRTPEEWLSMIRELDDAIGEYCHRLTLSDDKRHDLMQKRKKQSLVSIPDSLEWFRKATLDVQNQRG